MAIVGAGVAALAVCTAKGTMSDSDSNTVISFLFIRLFY
jgi:hypothetical protein